MRARLALAVSGVDHELREVSLKSKPAEMLAASPKGTVPVLVLTSGEVIDESLDIMRWALSQNDPEGCLTQGPMDDMLALIAGNDGEFKHSLDRYKYPNRYPLESGGDLQAFAIAHRSKAATWLQTLESRLSEGWLFSDRASLADVATLPFVRQFANTDPEWFAAQLWSLMLGWLDRFEASALFESVMAKRQAQVTPV